MKLADASRRKLERFFREYLDDEKFRLPPIDIYFGKFTKIFTRLIRVEGITLGRRIYIMPELIGRTAKLEPKLPERLAAHEIAHVLQYRKYGFIRFFYHYLAGYWRNLQGQEKWDLMTRQQAYLDIPFEAEARRIEKSFVNWCLRQRKKQHG